MNRQEITETAEWGVDRNNKTSKQQNIENLIHKFQIDYTDNFSHSKFTLDLGLGYLVQNYDDRSHAYDLILQQSDESLYAAMQQNLHRIDAYAELKWNPTNQLSLTGKIIADYLPNRNKIRLSYTDYTEDIAQHGVLYSPNLKIRYMFDTPTPNRDVDYMESLSLKSTLDISYQQTRSRPAPRQMSTYSDVSNPNWIEKGNPNLQPELFHQFSAVLNMGLPHNVRFSSSIGHFRSKNKIISYSFFETDATKIDW